MSKKLGEELDGLLGNYTSLNARLRTLNYSTSSATKDKISVHLHYPAFRDGEPTISDLIPAIANFLINFCLSTTELANLKEQLTNGEIDVNAYNIHFQILLRKAKKLFVTAAKSTRTVGESGELLLFILNEWVLKAPKILAKMSLKTNAQVPVHGADAVHCKYLEATDSLCFYFEESKLKKDINDALNDAINSITTSLQPEKIKHELDLVSKDIQVSGLNESAQKELLAYLDPEDDLSNKRKTAITCLISFEFSKYAELSGDEAEQQFCQEAKAFLDKEIPKLEIKFKANSITKPIEIFFLPLPSVDNFRKLFQDEIGWRNS